MRQKLFDKILREGRALTGGFEYRLIGLEIWKRPRVTHGGWQFERRIYNHAET